VEAAQEAISSPLLDNISIQGAAGVLINISGGMDLAIDEVTTISSIIQEAAGEEAEIIFGAVHDSHMKEEIRVTVIATGFENEVFAAAPVIHGSQPQRRPAPAMPPAEPSLRLNGTRLVNPAPPTQQAGRQTPTGPDLQVPTFIRRQMD
jgi:cell division protein FtsZ